MSFERFTQTGRRFQPVVSIWSRGQIGFNQGAVNKCKIKPTSFIVLFYDRDAKKVGIRITDDAKEEGVLKPKLLTAGAMISAKSFLDFYEIEYKQTIKYNVEFDAGNDLFVVDLVKGRLGKQVPENGE